MLVKCGDCASFEKSNGILPAQKNELRKPGNQRALKAVLPGQCKTFEIGKKTATPKQIEKAYAARGGCEFVDCTLRFCEKFNEKT